MMELKLTKSAVLQRNVCFFRILSFNLIAFFLIRTRMQNYIFFLDFILLFFILKMCFSKTKVQISRVKSFRISNFSVNLQNTRAVCAALLKQNKQINRNK